MLALDSSYTDAVLKRAITNQPVLTDSQRASSPDLAWVDTFSRALDTRFRFPGTNVRFGADFLLGLVPGLGDVLSMAFSGLLIVTMAKNGASAKLVARMLVNVLFDTLVGSIPVLGNIFDLFYKANYRNLELMREYYDGGKHRGSVWPLVAGIVAFLLVLLGITTWLIFAIFSWLSRLAPEAV